MASESGRATPPIAVADQRMVASECGQKLVEMVRDRVMLLAEPGDPSSMGGSSISLFRGDL